MALPSSGLDRSDGLNGQLGVPTPVSALKAKAGGVNINITQIPFNELPDSPTIERAEQCTITHVYECSWFEAANRIIFMPRGTIEVDSFGNYTKILSATIQHLPGDIARITKVSEGLNFDFPPDEFD